MKNLERILAALLLVLFSVQAWAGPTPGSQEGQRQEPLPIPPFKVIQSDRPSFQESIGGMVVSDPYQSSYDWVQTGIDTTNVEVKLLSDFVNEEGRFAANNQVKDKSELFIYLTRYNMGDPRVTDL